MTPRSSSNSGSIDLLSQKLDNFIEEERQWRKELRENLQNHEGRVQVLEGHQGIQNERHIATMNAIGDLREALKGKASAEALAELKGQVRLWDFANTIGAAAVAAAAFLLKK